MDDAKRRALVERRRLSNLRRRRAESSASFRRVAPQLCAAGIRFAKLLPVRNQALMDPLTCGPAADEELDFRAIPEAVTAPWSTPAERDALVRSALATLAGDDEPIALVWHPAKAGIRLDAAALKAHVRPLLDEGAGDTTWIASAAGGGWLIQVGFWSRTVSHAAAIPAPKALD